MLKKVLIVEDDYRQQDAYKNKLEGKVEILAAMSIAEAMRLFSENTDISLIVVDGAVDGRGDECDTPPLVQNFRKSFKGPMIAASSSNIYRQRLLKAGCNHEVANKDHVPAKILELLGP